jgi:hypothetical protein
VFLAGGINLVKSGSSMVRYEDIIRWLSIPKPVHN